MQRSSPHRFADRALTFVRSLRRTSPVTTVQRGTDAGFATPSIFRFLAAPPPKGKNSGAPRSAGVLFPFLRRAGTPTAHRGAARPLPRRAIGTMQRGNRHKTLPHRGGSKSSADFERTPRACSMSSANRKKAVTAKEKATDGRSNAGGRPCYLALSRARARQERRHHIFNAKCHERTPR